MHSNELCIFVGESRSGCTKHLHRVMTLVRKTSKVAHHLHPKIKKKEVQTHKAVAAKKKRKVETSSSSSGSHSSDSSQSETISSHSSDSSESSEEDIIVKAKNKKKKTKEDKPKLVEKVSKVKGKEKLKCKHSSKDEADSHSKAK